MMILRCAANSGSLSFGEEESSIHSNLGAIPFAMSAFRGSVKAGIPDSNLLDSS